MTNYNEPISRDELLAMPEADFVRLVNAAYKSYDSLLDLSRSPLAHSELIHPALVLDDLSPTADDRGRALRVALRWAVAQLAPAPPTYPLGAARPFDDPTWLDPLWWEYNLLRHRYVEPLTPDARYDLGERGFIRAICALTGIPDNDRFYAVRQQAISIAAHLLREQLAQPRRAAEIQRLAVEELLAGLSPRQEIWLLLTIAATFRATFPRDLLAEISAGEGLKPFQDALSYALQQRLLLTGDNGRNLWLPPALQSYLHVHQPTAALRLGHLRAARHYQREGNALEAAWHLRHGQAYAEAAAILLEAAPFLMGELQTEELAAELNAFAAHQFAPELWFQILMLRVDVYRKLGKRDAALEAGRAALRVTAAPAQQAQIYHRLGKLYENSEQRRALDYYQRAMSRLSPDAPEQADLYIDSGWIYIHQHKWTAAEENLRQALALIEPTDWRRQANTHNALASLYRQQQEYDRALHHGQQALVLREESGDLQLTAEARSNLALTYAAMGDAEAAMSAYQEARQIFSKIGNREAVGNVLLNMGFTLHHAGRLPEAIDYYQQSLKSFDALHAVLSQSQALYNLAEAHSALNDFAAARQFWQAGCKLSQQADLEGELVWYEKLQKKYPQLNPAADSAAPAADDKTPAPNGRLSLTAEDLTALRLAAQGYTTNRLLQREVNISASTATRRLQQLTAWGLLEKRGQGRSVQYFLTDDGRNCLE
jgi:tetratricopeptide (TPR) repeat protein